MAQTNKIDKELFWERLNEDDEERLARKRKKAHAELLKAMASDTMDKLQEIVSKNGDIDTAIMDLINGKS